jgi:hypothetical protein
MLALGVVACSGGGASTQSVGIGGAPPTPTPSASLVPSGVTPYRFLLGESLADTLSANPFYSAWLDGTHPIVILTGQGPYDVSQPFAPAAWGATYMVRFTSEEQMQAEFTTGEIPAFVQWVMYDNEPDTLPPTPPNELPPNDPALYYAAAASIAHANGKLFAATAGLSGSPAQTQAVFGTAANWDFYGVQTQTGELDLTQFHNNIVNTMEKVWAVNPKVPFSAGVGDYASGGLAAASQIVPALEAIPSNALVWLNFGPNPASAVGRYDIAIAIIQATLTAPRAPALTPP